VILVFRGPDDAQKKGGGEWPSWEPRSRNPFQFEKGKKKGEREGKGWFFFVGGEEGGGRVLPNLDLKPSIPLNPEKKKEGGD